MAKAPIMWFAGLILGGFAVVLVQGHGRLLEPPPRSSLWRYPKDYPGAEVNYNDNALTCGGFPVCNIPNTNNIRNSNSVTSLVFDLGTVLQSN